MTQEGADPGTATSTGDVRRTAPGTLAWSGEVDLAVVEDLADAAGVTAQALPEHLAADDLAVLDLGAATFLDSTALSLLIGLIGTASPARLVVRGAHGEPLRLLELTGVAGLVDLEA
jgi:anti-anti-sigma regulatory factor